MFFFSGESQSSFNLGNLEAGEYRDIKTTMYTNSRATGMQGFIDIGEERQQFRTTLDFNLPFNVHQKAAQELVVSANDEGVKNQVIDNRSLGIDIERDIPVTDKKRDDAFAVVFGIENYENVPSVKFAERDAAFVKEYFIKTLGIPEDHIFYKTSSSVTKGEFEKIFSPNGWLDKRCDSSSDVFVYYAGHGAPDIKSEKAYLIPFDGDPNYAILTGYSLDELYTNIARLKIKRALVFLDACFSGQDRDNKSLLADSRSVFIKPKAANADYKITIFSAAAADQVSSAWIDKKHGLFTYFMLKGLKGEAEMNGSKRISIRSLANYINGNVKRQAGYLDREQTPEVKSNEDNFILVE